MIRQSEINIRRRPRDNGVEYQGIVKIERSVFIDGSIQPMTIDLYSDEPMDIVPMRGVSFVDTARYDEIMRSNLRNQVHNKLYKEPRILVRELLHILHLGAMLELSPTTRNRVVQIEDELRRLDFL